ncbi:putative oxidoreductase [Burkholderia sp. YR290]|jgi:putative oxidoreductase|uniref:DoxX family protein n=1 Tax=Paraburkholderia hospita TaxID=169430 RepID=UPI0009A560C6|nr:DoxX family protein [Paraburkholderia hospita]SKD01852.1 putative oxidoreductase [Paraburkholderia hospita]SOE83831.1 putative oxidoreductase [Burkholderia sp. YR290]
MTTLRYHFLENQRDAMILLARIMILALYLYFGWTYLSDHATVLAYLRSVHAPVPAFTAIVATVIEFFGGLVLLLGFWTRPLAALFAVYTIGTGIIGHAFWNSTNPAEHHAFFVHFFKNISISAGFLFLCALGPGKYSIDGK